MTHHTPTFAELDRRIESAMIADQFRLRRRLKAIREAGGAGQHSAGEKLAGKRGGGDHLERWTEDLNRSIEQRTRREQTMPRFELDGSLPIAAKAAEIGRAVREHPVVIVCGETGSGKSTQLPKICLQIGRGIGGMIGHTQPRRIAARAIATRLANEFRSPLGQQVGFKVRFTDTTGPQTFVKLMTDGILLAETQHDRFLNAYDTIIIDEAHERSLNVDFLLGYLQRLQAKRRDLKLIITSATIDAERFSQHFADANTGRPAPVVEVSGRGYPVEIRYRPLLAEAADGEGRGGSREVMIDEQDEQQAIAEAVEELARSGPGDMLIFLPTERDIREVAKTLRGRTIAGSFEKTEILPLYARLSTGEQNKVFEPHPHRRLVLATNVAESSLTVPGIRFVIDTGTARISRYSPRRKVQRLPIEAISRASADQRAGRCGRVGPGICVRLFGEDDYLQRDRFTTPEIRRTNLAAVILQTKALKLGEIEEFPFLDPPQPEAIRDGYRTLFELGAIDDLRELTEIGRQLSRLPTDPRIGRMILAARDEHCLHDVLILAAVLEIQDPRERPVDKQQAADEAHAKFADPASDFVSYLKLWQFFHDLKGKLSRSQLRKACQQNFLSYMRMLEWQDIHRQLLQLANEAGWPTAATHHHSPHSPSSSHPPAETPPEKYAPLHRALLTGLLSNVAFRGDGFEYTGAGGMKSHLWPGSGVFKEKPAWIVAAEVVETSRQYVRTVARIDPAWIEPLAGHLIKRTHSDPHWSSRGGCAMAKEKVTLFGLPIVQERRVVYGPIDPAASRELFIRHALLAGESNLQAAFLTHNRKLVEEIELLAKKTRRNDLFVDLDRVAAIYAECLPADVYDVGRMQRWLKQDAAKHNELLCLKRDELLAENARIAPGDFPDQMTVGPAKLKLEYRFEPGNDDDGITLVVPKIAIGSLDAGQLGWLAPGLLEQKILALIRSLPKSLRRSFVPAPDVAKKAVALLRFGDGPFLQAVADALHKVCGERVRPADFDEEKLPPHLKMNVRVVEPGGKTAGSGRDLDTLRKQFTADAAATITAAAAAQSSRWNRDGVTQWDFGDLPATIEVRQSAIAATAYPTLIDRGESVSLSLADTAAKAAGLTRAGLRRLFVLAENKELRAQIAWLPNLDKIKVYASPLCKPKELEQQLVELLAERVFLDGGEECSVLGVRCSVGELPRNAEQFQRARLGGREQMPAAVQALTRLALPLFEAFHQARLAIEQSSQPRLAHAAADAKQQLAELTKPGFLTATPWPWLQHFPRYFQAIAARLKKLAASQPSRDREFTDELARLWRMYQQRLAEQLARGVIDPELLEYRWLLEEYRVSLFAQELRTAVPVSEKRLEKQWAKVQA